MKDSRGNLRNRLCPNAFYLLFGGNYAIKCNMTVIYSKFKQIIKKEQLKQMNS